MVEEDGRVPLIDIGTLDKIRDGSIKIYGDLDRLLADSVVFTDAAVEKFDAIILATGFRPGLRQLIPDVEGVFDEHRMPLVTGQATNAPPGFISAVKSRQRRDNCGRSDLRRGVSQKLPNGISRRFEFRAAGRRHRRRHTLPHPKELAAGGVPKTGRRALLVPELPKCAAGRACSSS